MIKPGHTTAPDTRVRFGGITISLEGLHCSCECQCNEQLTAENIREQRVNDDGEPSRIRAVCANCASGIHRDTVPADAAEAEA